MHLSVCFVSILRMLKIRLQRVGRKHEPIFRVVLTDSKNGTKSGRYLEVLGSYDARNKEKQTVNADRVKYWIKEGAQPSDTLHNFLINQKILQGKKRNVLSRKSPIKAEAPKTDGAVSAPAQPPKEEAK